MLVAACASSSDAVLHLISSLTGFQVAQETSLLNKGEKLGQMAFDIKKSGHGLMTDKVSDSFIKVFFNKPIVFTK